MCQEAEPRHHHLTAGDLAARCSRVSTLLTDRGGAPPAGWFCSVVSGVLAKGLFFSSFH